MSALLKRPVLFAADCVGVPPAAVGVVGGLVAATVGVAAAFVAAGVLSPPPPPQAALSTAATVTTPRPSRAHRFNEVRIMILLLQARPVDETAGTPDPTWYV